MGSRSFDGVDDYLRAVHDAALGAPSTAVTIACWYNTGSDPRPNWNAVVHKNHNLDGSSPWVSYGLSQRASSTRRYLGQVSFDGDNTAYRDTGLTSSPVPENSWFYMAVRWNSGGDLRIDIWDGSGTLVESSSTMPPSLSVRYGGGDFTICKSENTVYTPGKVADLFVHNGRLADADLDTLRTTGTPPVTPGVGFWPLRSGLSPEPCTLGPGPDLTVIGATYDSADSPPTTAGPSVAEVEPDDASHTHTATSPVVTGLHIIQPDSTSHAQSVDVAAVEQTHVLAPASALQAHAATSPTFDQVHTVDPEGVTHTQEVSSPTLTGLHFVEPLDTTHAHAADEVVVIQSHDVAPEDGTHAHTVDATTVDQTHILAPEDATHEQASTSPTVGSIGDLVPDNAVQAQAATSPDLAQTHEVVPEHTAHAHSVTSPTLGDIANIDPADTLHEQSAGSPDVSADSIIVPEDAVHVHSTGTPTFEQRHSIVPVDAEHTHSVSEPLVGGESSIFPNDASHLQAVTEASLDQTHHLAPVNAFHGTAVSEPSLSQLHYIAPDDAHHAQWVTIPAVYRPVGADAGPRRTINVTGRDRSVDVPTFNRVHVVHERSRQTTP